MSGQVLGRHLPPPHMSTFRVTLPVLKRSGPVSNYTVSSTTDVKNKWDYTSISHMPTFLENIQLYPTCQYHPYKWSTQKKKKFNHATPTLHNLSDWQRHKISFSLFLSFSFPHFGQFYDDFLLKVFWCHCFGGEILRKLPGRCKSTSRDRN